MTTKSLIYHIPKRLLSWFTLNYFSYSIASVAHIQAPFEVDKDPLATPEYITAGQALKSRFHPDRLVHVLDSTSDVTSALKLFKWISTQKNFQQTAKTYADMILKLGMVGDHEEMDILLNEVVKLQLQSTEQAFDFLIHSFCKNCRPVEALKVFKYSILAKHKLSVSTCNTLLATFASQSGNFNSLMFIYKEMVKAGILPDVETLNYLIKGLCEIGCLDLAINQFQRMSLKRCGPNDQTFEIIIKALCTSGRSDEAVMIMNHMLELGCTPHPNLYYNVIPLLCSVNKYEEGIKLFRMRKVRAGELDLYLYSDLIKCLCTNQQMESAVELFQEMLDSGIAPLNSMSVDIVDGFCKIGKFSEAMSLLNEEQLLQVEPYNALLKGFCMAGRYQEAANNLKKMAERGLTNLLSWNILIKGLCDEGFVGKAFEVIGRMIVSSYVVEGTIYSAIITGYCKIGDYENALAMFELSCVYDYSLDSESCSQLIEGLCVGKKVQEAAEVFYYITSKGCLVSSIALDELIQGICHNGKVHEAIKMRSYAVYNGASCNSITYSTILLGLLGLDKPKEALPCLSLMLVDGCTLDVTTYCILIHGLCSKGMTREAADLFNQMVHDNLVPTFEILELLLFRLTRNSQLHMVVCTLDYLINDEGLLNPPMCNLIIYTLVKEGYKQVACKLLDKMLDKGWVPDANTHVMLVGNNNLEDRNGNNDDMFDAPCDDKVGKILAEGLDDFDMQMTLR
ncbi:pentatricopeptide repeat-containing protein [Canna indica]|uniref:Pentatricopeptide repeat-containing protein n=1 Tax=Canna indica TaxID=4628 RepID=A0AAQ3L548_9LILI|nr:pentatricopeptide repeat-containing protein [Canna indica]